MLTAREYFHQIIAWHHQGRHDLIKIASKKRYEAYKVIRQASKFSANILNKNPQKELLTGIGEQTTHLGQQPIGNTAPTPTHPDAS